ncbi:MAG: hypothetical protein GQ540_03605 [Lutibacter sp.]|uniref:hypothetical protein n=1 Tax=Lutibacter sp. TaxID=1925666 RepID=UPI0019F87C06|nr:hypothetical protein [Lutibacter sp.]NOR27598.1 hypothetical protein [Lutibacter sp.]
MALDNFQGTRDIILQTNSKDVPYSFTFTVNSSATANDGALPFGTNVSTAVVTAHIAETGVADSEIVANSSVGSNVVTVDMTYPSTNGVNWYHLTFVLTLDNGAILEFDYNRVYVEDR